MITSKAFYLVRHGESEANLAKIAAGVGVDSPLTDLGRAQARAIAPVLQHLPVKPSHIFHSPMIRATETAKIINSVMNLGITKQPGLEEHHIGELEGQPWDVVLPYFQGHMDPPGGETMKDFESRVREGINKVLAEDLDGPPLIVAHGGLFHAFSRIYAREFSSVPNCLIHHFDPYPDHAPFPWQIFEFHVSENKLDPKRSMNCGLYSQM